jgi:hypothetical protein
MSTQDPLPQSPFSRPTRIGDEVAYYNARGIRRVGIVKGWREGKVMVQHNAGYFELIADEALYLLD